MAPFACVSPPFTEGTRELLPSHRDGQRGAGEQGAPEENREEEGQGRRKRVGGGRGGAARAFHAQMAAAASTAKPTPVLDAMRAGRRLCWAVLTRGAEGRRLCWAVLTRGAEGRRGGGCVAITRAARPVVKARSICANFHKSDKPRRLFL